MGKLTKHAEVLTQLHSLVKKQAEEAQKNISGVPGETVKSESISEENDHTNKNSVGPENNPQGVSQKPSEDSSAPVAEAKTAGDLGAQILELIRKEAAEAATGVPGEDTKPEKVNEKHETVDKNDVKSDNNTPQTTGDQKPSTDDSKPAADAKTASAQVDELASKVASYELGRQFCAALLKAASHDSSADETLLMKEAGRRDFEALIAQAASELDHQQAPDEQESIKQAEAAGAAYFEEVLKQAALEEAVSENEQLKVKVAELSTVVESVNSKEEQEKQAQEETAKQVKLAEAVAAIVLEKLKAEAADKA
jgi:hypothetical protein